MSASSLPILMVEPIALASKAYRLFELISSVKSLNPINCALTEVVNTLMSLCPVNITLLSVKRTVTSSSVKLTLLFKRGVPVNDSTTKKSVVSIALWILIAKSIKLWFSCVSLALISTEPSTLWVPKSTKRVKVTSSLITPDANSPKPLAISSLLHSEAVT